VVKLNNNWTENWAPRLRIEIYPSPKTASEFSYFTGDGVQKITAAPEAGGLTIQLGDLGAEGSVEVYCKRPKEMTKNGARLRDGGEYKYDSEAQKLTVPFKGATKLALKGTGSLFNP